MDNFILTQMLIEERCGLYFLAGFDPCGRGSGAGVVTVHAVDGALTGEQSRYITDSFARHHPQIEVRLRFHSKQELHAPESLESFARRFRHAEILADPTGAFGRVSKLLTLAEKLRAELGGSIGRILWRAETSTLVVLTSAAGGIAVDDVEALNGRIAALHDGTSCPDLKRAIRAVRAASQAPSGRYTPVDDVSRIPVVKARRRTGMLARVSGLAALIGFGAVAAAQASVPAAGDEGVVGLPGITGLIGLTTLGENSYGVRNRFQAAGGLRLYFGETGILMATILSPLGEGADYRSMFEENGASGNTTWPKPERIQYSG